jgi:hypothetical protein
MKKFLPPTITSLILLVLAGCNLFTQPTPETEGLIATQVSIVLTETAIALPQETQPVPADTAAPQPTSTATMMESTSTPTSTATTTETLTPTLDQSDPATQLGSPAWAQDFSGTTSAWDFESDQATFKTENGYLNITAKANPNWHSWYVSSPKLTNAYVETTYDISGCSGSDRFGLAVRASSDGQNFYFIMLTCDGRWGFFRMEPDVNIQQIIGYQSAEPLQGDAQGRHRVGIWMKGSAFTFYIDGEEVGTATDTAITSEGYTGFLIAFANTNGFTVRIDELKYWNVP